MYSTLPPATVPLTAEAWDAALAAGLALQQDLLRDLGFTFEAAAAGGFGFYRRVDDAQLDVRIERALAQERAYEANDRVNEGGS